MDEKEMYAYWLCSISGIGTKTIRKLLIKAGSPEAVYRHCETLIKDPALALTQRQISNLLYHKSFVNPEKELSGLSKKQIRFVWIEQDEYPARLKDIPDPPALLYYKGHLSSKPYCCVSVVGARDCTAYGRYVAVELGKQLAQNGVVVVSGLARGIDCITQSSALEQEGTSIAVMGCGADICYPAQNRDIYDALTRQGAIVSEYAPGTSPSPALFPPRNRIISGLSDVLVVVEARERSGTLITVDMALEQGKDVYVVPGRVTDSLSIGCNELIRQGAGIITSVEAFVDHVCQKTKAVHSIQKKSTGTNDGAVGKLSPLRQDILKLLDINPKTADELYESILKKANYSLQEVLSELLELCIEGKAKQVGSSYALTCPHPREE